MYQIDLETLTAFAGTPEQAAETWLRFTSPWVKVAIRVHEMRQDYFDLGTQIALLPFHLAVINAEELFGRGRVAKILGPL